MPRPAPSVPRALALTVAMVLGLTPLACRSRADGGPGGAGSATARASESPLAGAWTFTTGKPVATCRTTPLTLELLAGKKISVDVGPSGELAYHDGACVVPLRTEGSDGTRAIAAGAPPYCATDAAGVNTAVLALSITASAPARLSVAIDGTFAGNLAGHPGPAYDCTVKTEGELAHAESQ